MTTALHCDFFYSGRVDEKYSLNANALKYSADSHSLGDAMAGVFDNHAFVALCTLFTAFDDLYEDFDCVAHIKLGKV
jgi:hypothetical protein